MWNHEKLWKSNGVWVGDTCAERIFNHDETPQFIDYGVDHSALGLVCAGREETCKEMIQENSDGNAKDVEKLTMSQRMAVKVLKATWKSLGLYHDEEDLKGK